MERRTRQREFIMECFQTSAGPLTPAEVLSWAKRRMPGIGIATIYRNLKAFVESGTLRVVPVPGEADRYEIAGKQHHHHFFCRTCKKAFEMTGCPGSLASLAPSGFKVEEHEIFLYGQCRQCLEKNATKTDRIKAGSGKIPARKA